MEPGTVKALQGEKHTALIDDRDGDGKAMALSLGSAAIKARTSAASSSGRVRISGVRREDRCLGHEVVKAPVEELHNLLGRGVELGTDLRSHAVLNGFMSSKSISRIIAIGGQSLSAVVVRYTRTALTWRKRRHIGSSSSRTRRKNSSSGPALMLPS